MDFLTERFRVSFWTAEIIARDAEGKILSVGNSYGEDKFFLNVTDAVDYAKKIIEEKSPVIVTNYLFDCNVYFEKFDSDTGDFDNKIWIYNYSINYLGEINQSANTKAINKFKKQTAPLTLQSLFPMIEF